MNYEEVVRPVLDVISQLGEEIHARCPFHPDTGKPSFSFNISEGTWFCFSQCGGGTYKQFVKKCKEAGISLQGAGRAGKAGGSAGGKNAQEGPAKYIPEADIIAAQKRLWTKKGREAREALKARGIKEKTIKAQGLGLEPDGSRVWFPHHDGIGYRNVKRYDYLKATDEKFKNYEKGYGCNILWPPSALAAAGPDNPLLLLEGEPDVMLAQSLGLETACTATAGAGAWEDSFTRELAGQTVAICYDTDDAGMEGANKVARALSALATPVILRLPIQKPKGKDFTDYLRSVGGDVREFIERVLSPALQTNSNIRSTSLAGASGADNYEKRIAFKAIVSGKDLTPYMVPKKLAIKCSFSSTSAVCTACPIRAGRGQCDIDLPETAKPILVAPGSSDISVRNAIQEHLQLPSRCPGKQIEISQTIPLWDVTLTNDLDSQEGRSDAEYVERRAYTLAALEPNVPYEFGGIATRDPKTQYALVLITKAKGSHTSLDAFTTKGKEKLLKLFQAVK